MELIASDLQLIEEFTFNTEENVNKAVTSLRVSEWLHVMNIANEYYTYHRMIIS